MTQALKVNAPSVALTNLYYNSFAEAETFRAPLP